MDQPKLERLLRLIQLLVGNRRSTVELAERLDCSQKTVQRYIDTIQNAGFVVEYHRRGVPFLSTNQGSLKDISDLVHFSPEEAYLLRVAIDSINDDTALKQNLKKKLYNLYNYPWLADIIVKPEQGENVQRLIEAISDERCVILRDYRSSNSNRVNDRQVEPYKFTTNYQQVWCYEPSSQTCKMFKISRIETVEILDKPWEYKDRHADARIDVFRISAESYIGTVIMQLNLRAYNLLVEEYPLSEQHITAGGNNVHLFNCPVCSYEGPGRFVMGLFNDVQILGDDHFISFIRQKISNLHP